MFLNSLRSKSQVVWQLVKQLVYTSLLLIIMFVTLVVKEKFAQPSKSHKILLLIMNMIVDAHPLSIPD